MTRRHLYYNPDGTPMTPAQSRQASRKAHPTSYKLSQYRGHLRKKYGLSVEDYQRLFTAQGGVCAICRRPESSQRLAVDHDHQSGTVRGLLCYVCNTRLEWFAEYEVAAHFYLSRSSSDFPLRQL